MTHQEFVIKLLDLQLELNKAVFLIDYSNIEYYSKKIGKLIVRFLNENKMTISDSKQS